MPPRIKKIAHPSTELDEPSLLASPLPKCPIIRRTKKALPSTETPIALKSGTTLVKKPTASSIKAALRLKYAAPQYAILEEVRNATGMLKKRFGKKPRYADMIAMGLWPKTTNLEIIGFEVKVSRADWKAEISDEKKAVAVQQFCDRWYLVTHSTSIVHDGELPPNWGWLVVTDTKVTEMITAPLLPAKTPSKAFLASLMRNATTSNPDYVAVQSKIIERQMGKNSILHTNRAGAKKTISIMAAQIKLLKKTIADLELQKTK